jgi:hypothetical protein
MICEVIGVLLSVGIPSIFITIFGSGASCESLSFANQSYELNISTNSTQSNKMVFIILSYQFFIY